MAGVNRKSEIGKTSWVFEQNKGKRVNYWLKTWLNAEAHLDELVGSRVFIAEVDAFLLQKGFHFLLVDSKQLEIINNK